MKILHTSDWHLGDRLGMRRIERRPHLQSSLVQIAQKLDEHDVDVMLVSGDVFSDQLRQEECRSAIWDIKEAFLPFLERGGTILAITGNHDSEIFFNTLHDTLELVTGGRSGPPGANPSGRFYAIAYPKVIQLADRQGREAVQFVLMPYPTRRLYLRGDNTGFNSIEELHLKLKAEFTTTFKDLVDDEVVFDSKLASVLVSHIHIGGVTMPHSLFRPTEADQMIFSQSDLPTGWAYVACGHIHKPQAIFPGAEHVRYAGSIAPMDLGETSDEKSVTLVEIANNVRVSTPQVLPLQTTPLYRVEVSDIEDIPRLKDRYPHTNTALVKYFLHWDASKGYNREEMRRDIERIFPNWYDYELVLINPMGVLPVDGRPRQPDNVRATLLDYLKDCVPTTDPLRAKLLERAEKLLIEGGY